MGCHNIVGLIVVLTLKADTVSVQSQMAVRFHKPRIHLHPLYVNDLRILGYAKAASDGFDLSFLH